jgi:hypothetical protein
MREGERGHILFYWQQGFSVLPYKKRTPQKLAKNRTKKAATPNRQAGATADTQ